jgi:hypothetical protein
MHVRGRTKTVQFTPEVVPPLPEMPGLGSRPKYSRAADRVKNSPCDAPERVR